MQIISYNWQIVRPMLRRFLWIPELPTMPVPWILCWLRSKDRFMH